MMPEWIKALISILTPIIGALAGVFLVPLVENRKNQTLKKELIQNLRIEIDDLSHLSEEKAKNLFKSREQLIEYLSLRINKVNLNGLSEIELYYAHESLTKAYSYLSPDERKAIKALINNVNVVNNTIKLIIDDWENVSHWDSVVRHTANVYWICTRMTNDANFTYDKDHDNDIVNNKALIALGINLI